MQKVKFILCIIILLITFQSCGTIKEGFKSPKKNSTDEFLVEKKNPLKIPPNYDELPVPNNSEDQGNDGIKDIISNNENVSGDVNTNTQGNTNLEKVLLDKIKKN